MLVGAPRPEDGARRGSEPTLGRALAVSALLDDEGKARLRAALVAAGWPGSSRGPLDDVPLVGAGQPARRRQLRACLETALGSGWQSGVAGGRRLGDVFPAIVELPDGPLASDVCWGRLRGSLERAGWACWSALLDVTVSQVAAQTGVGAKALVELTGMCFERSLDSVAVAWTTDPGADDLTVVLRYERGAGAQPVTEALLDLRSGGAPDRVRDAADRLVRERARWALDAEAGVVALLHAAGDERARSLWQAWSSWRDPRFLQQLATDSGLTPQNASQIVHRFDGKLRAALAAAPGPLPWLASRLAARLGPVATVQQADAAVDRLGLAGAAADAMVWLAGPYRPVSSPSGWLAVEPQAIVARTAACLAADGGVRRMFDVEAELDLTPDQARSWLGACGATVICDLAVSLSGRLVVVVERILDAHGRPLTQAEIAACLADGGREATEGALAAVLRKKPFARQPDGALRLADWGTEMPAPRRDRPRDDRRAAAETPAPHRSPWREPAPERAEAVVAEEGSDCLWLWVKVDADVLHGVEAVVPSALVEGLGLADARRTFSSRYGPIVVAADGPQPVRGSVRAIALAAGARPGDTLLLGFSARGGVDVDVRRAGQADDTGQRQPPTPQPHPHLSPTSMPEACHDH